MFDVSVEDIFGGGKFISRANARSPFCYSAIYELGMTAVEPARLLNLDQSAISKAVLRGENLS